MIDKDTMAVTNEDILHKVEELRYIVWGEDIPSFTCPEYREHHESITKILEYIDDVLLPIVQCRHEELQR